MPDWTNRSSYKGQPLEGLSQRQPPCNTQAEHALLGALLANNKAYERVGDFLLPEHFADPIHGRIYSAIATYVEAGKLADSVTLKAEFENSGVLDEVGGTPYLAQLLAAMVGIINAGEYGQAVYDAWVRRQLIDIGEQVVNRAFSSTPDHPGSKQIEEAEQSLFALATNGQGSNSGPVTIGAAARSAVEQGELAKKDQRRITPTGLPSLDNSIIGLLPGHLIVIGGRPSMGKTALARKIAINTAGGRFITEHGEFVDDQRLGLPVFWVALEETSDDFGAAAIAQMARVTTHQVYRGFDGECDAALRVVGAQKRYDQMPLEIDDRPAQSLAQIAMRARRAKRKHKKLGLVVVDYMQQMADPTRSRDKRLAVSENVRGLKNLAKELECPVLALSQLSRGVENRPDKRPTLADLMETGEIEAAADVAILLHREEYYYRHTSPKQDPDDLSDGAAAAALAKWQDGLNRVAGVAEAIVAKVRRGATGTVMLKFNGPHVDFEEMGQ